MSSGQVILAMIAGAVAHPSIHDNFNPAPYMSRGEVPPIQSYHVHVQYVKGGELSNKSAFLFREAYAKHFNLTGTKLCQGGPLASQDHMCLFPVEWDGMSSS